VNTVVIENGKEINLEERGINTDIGKAQIITKDDVTERIDTVLHTDLLNKDKREDLVNDLNTIGENSKIIGESVGTKLNNNKNGSSEAEIWELEKQTLANITKAEEEAIKNKEYLSITNEERNDYDKLAEKYKDYGVSEIVVVSNDTVFRDSAGNIIEGAHAGFDKNTGVIYITEDTAKKPLGEFNKIVGEEIGELYAHKNGLAVENNNGVMVAEQIGQIFGEQMSKGKDSDTEYTGNIIVNNSIKDVKVDGTEAVTAVVVVGAVVIVGGVVYYCSDPKAAQQLGEAVQAAIDAKIDETGKKINTIIKAGKIIGAGIGGVFKSQVGVGETIPTPDTDSGAFTRGKNDGSTGYEGKDGSWWEKDRAGDRSHGGSSWKRWPNKKDKKKIKVEGQLERMEKS
jgi:hypothetical protein